MRLIDADALKERFRKRIKWLDKDVHDQYSLGLFHGCEYDADLINEIPTIDVAPVVHGRWLDTGCYGNSKNPIYMCSNCRKEVEDYYIKNHKFCLHCGARMDGE